MKPVRTKNALFLAAAGVFILSGCWLGYVQLRDHLAARALPVAAPAKPAAVESPETLAPGDVQDPLLQAALADPDAFDAATLRASAPPAIAASPPSPEAISPVPPAVAQSTAPEPRPSLEEIEADTPAPPDRIDRIVASYASMRSPEARDPDSAYNTAQRERMASNILARAEAHRARRTAEREGESEP